MATHYLKNSANSHMPPHLRLLTGEQVLECPRRVTVSRIQLLSPRAMGAISEVLLSRFRITSDANSKEIG